jgi:nucleoside-diphosphate-sugar epimerase
MIIITGKNGSIATHLQCALEKEDIVLALTKDECECSSIRVILEEKQPDYIYHTGAELYHEDKMFESNVLLTYTILEYCRKAHNLKRLIIMGSSSEYGKKDKPMAEDDVLEPRTIYEGTKSAASMLAQSYAFTYHIPIFIIRPFTIYGRGEKQSKFLQRLFHKKQNGDTTLSLSEGVHDYVYIDDFIKAVQCIVLENKNTFDIINIGSGIQTTNKTVVRTFERVTNHYFTKVTPLSKKVYDSDMWVCDTSKVDRYYKTQITLEKGISLMNEM